jgi:hypothetical protein
MEVIAFGIWLGEWLIECGFWFGRGGRGESMGACCLGEIKVGNFAALAGSMVVLFSICVAALLEKAFVNTTALKMASD